MRLTRRLVDAFATETGFDLLDLTCGYRLRPRHDAEHRTIWHVDTLKDAMVVLRGYRADAEKWDR